MIFVLRRDPKGGPFFPLLSPVAISLVIATGLVAGLGRVEFPSPFIARLRAMPVTFYDVRTREPLPNNPFLLWGKAMRGQLGYWVRVVKMPPDFLLPVLQSLFGWLSLWLAMGLTGSLLRRGFLSPLWWRLGSSVGFLFALRLTHVLAASHWVWIPDWNPLFIQALVDMLLGISVPPSLLWAVMARGLFWLLTALSFWLGTFFVLRFAFRLSKGQTFIGGLLAYLLSRLFYVIFSLPLNLLGG